MLVNTKRHYQIALCEGSKIALMGIEAGLIIQPKEHDYEYIYALNEMLDEILDLKVGDSLYFKHNRDNKDSKAIILRTA